MKQSLKEQEGEGQTGALHPFANTTGRRSRLPSPPRPTEARLCRGWGRARPDASRGRRAPGLPPRERGTTAALPARQTHAELPLPASATPRLKPPGALLRRGSTAGPLTTTGPRPVPPPPLPPASHRRARQAAGRALPLRSAAARRDGPDRRGSDRAGPPARRGAPLPLVSSPLPARSPPCLPHRGAEASQPPPAAAVYGLLSAAPAPRTLSALSMAPAGLGGGSNKDGGEPEPPPPWRSLPPPGSRTHPERRWPRSQLSRKPTPATPRPRAGRGGEERREEEREGRAGGGEGSSGTEAGRAQTAPNAFARAAAGGRARSPRPAPPCPAAGGGGAAGRVLAARKHAGVRLLREIFRRERGAGPGYPLCPRPSRGRRRVRAAGALRGPVPSEVLSGRQCP